jgi:hypothetical protein
VRKKKVLTALTAAAAMLLQGMPLPSVHAASHREAPLIANDPAADITDFYMFRSYEDGMADRVVFIMNVIPGQEPSSGPNYFNFADDVAYDINLDLNADGESDDVTYRVRFTTEFRGVTAALGLPVANAAVPPITKLDGSPESDGLGVRQRYTVTEIRGPKTSQQANLGVGTMFAVPSNMGPGTMPMYEDLASQGIYSLINGGRVFAGQRDEAFYIDLGATFDSLNFRRTPPVLSDSEDASDSVNPFGVDHFSGFNVNTIAIEVPISSLGVSPTAVIGAYASTARQRFATRRGAPLRTENLTQGDIVNDKGILIQVARMANPLVNELIIGTPQKDVWNATEPKDEFRFKDFYLNSRLATVINLVFGLGGAAVELPTAGRTDLLNALLKYPSQPQNGDCTKASPCSELLRLNLGVPPTPAASQKRLTVLAGDSAGWPNGRRPNDDVTDVALRVVAGVLISPAPGSAALKLGDGVNFNIGAEGSNLTANGISTKFPFLPTPFDGRDRRHIDCANSDEDPCP